MKYLGCAYYPEYWGRERVAVDARLMRAAGINIVRIGEFAWSRIEPTAGQLQLDWLHECVETLAAHAIAVLICTPTATPPAWLTQRHPETLLVRGDGSRAEHGHRRHYCPTSPTYRQHSVRITAALARALAPHPNIVAWQLDNEFGPESGWCHCENCQARFQAWLQERYGSVAELNRRWRTGFWSVDFSDWSQVRLADGRIEMYSSQRLDSRRFWSAMMLEFAREQTAVLRQHQPRALVTTNGMGPIYGPINYYELFADLDVACDDLYFDVATLDADVATMNIFRSIKPGRRFWVTETGAGALDHNRPPQPDQFRAWAWSSWAHGADAHFVFRWRTCLSGHEQELQGILEHSGHPRHRYRAVQRCFQEIAGLRDRLADLPLPAAPVAIVQDYDVLWAYEAARIGKDVDYPGLIYRVHRELYRRHVVADIIPPDRDLAGYRLVILPSLLMIRPEFAERLTEFVQAGGTVLALGQIGMRDFNDNYLPDLEQQPLRGLLGVTVAGGMYLTSHVGPDEALWVPAPKGGVVAVPVRGRLGGKPVRGNATVWIGDLDLCGGRTLLEFAGEAYRGQPAVVEKTTGSGRAVYAAAARLDDRLFGRLLDMMLTQAGVATGPKTPLHVEVVARGAVTFAINHTATPVQVKLGLAGSAVVGQYRQGTARLPPYGVCVVEKTRAPASRTTLPPRRTPARPPPAIRAS